MSLSCTLRRAVTLAVCTACGCATPMNGKFLTLRGKEKDKTQAQADESGEAGSLFSSNSTTAEKGRGAGNAVGRRSAPKGSQRDPQTQELIDEELSDATPEEREALLSDLEGLDPELVRRILRIRRSVRQIGQKDLVARRDPGADMSRPGDLSSSPRQSAGFGHTGTTPYGDPNSQRLADLGRASPWDAPQARLAGANARSAVAGRDQRANPENGHPAVPSRPPHSDVQVQTVSGNAVDVGNAAGNQLSDLKAMPHAPAPTAQRPADGPISVLGGGIEPIPSSAQRQPSLDARQNPAPPTDALHTVERQRHVTPLPVNGVANNGPSPGSAANTTATVAVEKNQPTPPVTPAATPPATTATNGPTAAPPNADVLAAAAGQTTASKTDSSWKKDLERLISLAEVDAVHAAPGPTEAERLDYIQKHVHLRMLYLMAGRAERAMEPIASLEPADQEFWQQTIFALWSYFDSEGMPERAERATQTIAQLKSATQRLQEIAQLELRNVSFCHKISSYGDYERFDRDEFSPGQPVLVYAEVDNFKSEPITDGQVRTILKSTIEIYKAGPNGDLVDRIEFSATEDLCRNQRRDYFHSYEFRVPQRISLGPHILKLAVEDQLSRKIATYSLNFTVN